MAITVEALNHPQSVKRCAECGDADVTWGMYLVNGAWVCDACYWA